MTILESSIIEQQPAGFSIGARLLYLLLAVVGVVLAAFVIITPFDLQTQAAFAVFAPSCSFSSIASRPAWPR
jgi:hypothetical protein